jgi:hypothetical protein
MNADTNLILESLNGAMALTGMSSRSGLWRRFGHKTGHGYAKSEMITTQGGGSRLATTRPGERNQRASPGAEIPSKTVIG